MPDSHQPADDYQRRDFVIGNWLSRVIRGVIGSVPVQCWGGGLSQTTVYARPTTPAPTRTIRPARYLTKPATKSTPHDTKPRRGPSRVRVASFGRDSASAHFWLVNGVSDLKHDGRIAISVMPSKTVTCAYVYFRRIRVRFSACPAPQTTSRYCSTGAVYVARPAAADQVLGAIAEDANIEESPRMSCATPTASDSSAKARPRRRRRTPRTPPARSHPSLELPTQADRPRASTSLLPALLRP